MLAEVLKRDARILTASVTLTAVITRGLGDITLDVSGTTALGPFRFVKPISELTSADLEGTS